MIFKKFFNANAPLVEEFSKEFNLSQKTTYLILSRGMSTKEEVRNFLSTGDLLDPFLIDGMKEIVERLKLAKEMGDRVLIFGDYDVDGISATAIMLKTLKIMGIDAMHYLPNRYVDGYGLTCEVLDKICDQFSPDLIITVDCGISCAKEVEYAKEKGVEIVITDHHEIPEVLPDTLVLNAKIEGQKYPFRELCGTGLAYKISEAILGQKKAEQFLPIAAIATIADIVPLVGENRNIVKKGLSCLNKLPLGVKELFHECKLSLEKANSTDISFKIAPRINSSGRMGDANDSLMLYMSEDLVEVRKYIQKIKEHNTKRQELSAVVMEDCEKAIAKMDLAKTRVICLASKKWDQGILGIACARLVEKFNRPVFLFSQVDDVLHGSGRSITDINIHELLSSQKDILQSFGGHTMAAGLTLKRDKYEEFCNRVNAFVFEKVNPQVFIPIKYYDLDVKESDLDEQFLNELSLLEPFGCENPRPRLKISSDVVEIEPKKYMPQHADISVGNLKLTYFNFSGRWDAIRFARYKSFIFEMQATSGSGVVSEFEMGAFITPDAHMFTYPVQLEQLCHENTGAKFSFYPQEKLLSFVANSEVFGTAFVAYSAYDFVNFSKTFSKENIFHVGIFDRECLGYNSLLLSPMGLNWAKNFKKIVFLSPVLDEGFLSALGKVCDAEIFVPMEREKDMERFARIDVSRETFGKAFKILTGNTRAYSLVDLFEKNARGKMNFDTFYAAYLVFKELGLVRERKAEFLDISAVRTVKRNLSESNLYNKLCLLKNVSSAKKSQVQ